MSWNGKNILSKEEFSKKCLCGHAKSSHHGCSGCVYCPSCEFYESQFSRGNSNSKQNNI